MLPYFCISKTILCLNKQITYLKKIQPAIGFLLLNSCFIYMFFASQLLFQAVVTVYTINVIKVNQTLKCKEVANTSLNTNNFIEIFNKKFCQQRQNPIFALLFQFFTIKRKQLIWQSTTLPRSGWPVRARSFALNPEPCSGFFLHHALVVELVDTQDLKSCSPQRECGFDSRLGHYPFAYARGFFLLSCGYHLHAMSHHKHRKQSDCLNCGTIVTGNFCQNCGQENIEVKESFFQIVYHFIEDITHFDGKLIKTLKLLISKPGFLTEEYVAGKRATYIHPIRMYIFISAVFFFSYFLENKKQQMLIPIKQSHLALYLVIAPIILLRNMIMLKKSYPSKKETNGLQLNLPNSKYLSIISTEMIKIKYQLPSLIILNITSLKYYTYHYPFLLFSCGFYIKGTSFTILQIT